MTTKYTHRLNASLVIAAAFAFTACSGSEKAKDSTLAADSTLNKNLAMAGSTTPATPALADAPAASAAEKAAAEKKGEAKGKAEAKAEERRAERKAEEHKGGNTPAPSNGGGRVGTIASGSAVQMTANTTVCTNTFTVGQPFTASVTSAVAGSNGASIPAGATVNLEPTTLKRQENASDHVTMEFAAKSVAFGGNTYPLNATITGAEVSKVRNEPTSKDAQKVAGGAVVGAIAGRLLGKSTKATVIGGAVGAAAGAGVAAGTANYEGCVNAGAKMAIALNSPLQVKL